VMARRQGPRKPLRASDFSPPLSPTTRFVVKYYDRALSRKGRGTQWRGFASLEAAEAFAAQNQIYAQPCIVEPIVADGVEVSRDLVSGEDEAAADEFAADSYETMRGMW
jgi:hypothetical protein